MSLPLPAERYVESIRTDSDRFDAAVTAAPLAPVAACPDWDNTALAEHMGDVFNFAATQIRASTTEMTRPDQSAKADPLSWYQTSAGALIDALAQADPDQPGWSWAGTPTLSFYFRRMASEIAVHRVDAQRAAGVAETPIPGDIATDAIDEVIEVGMQHRMRGPDADYPTGSLHLHRTDGDGEWMLTAADGVLVATHEHGKGDAALRGRASDLLLFLWGRGRGELDLFGDEAVAEAWSAVAP